MNRPWRRWVSQLEIWSAAEAESTMPFGILKIGSLTFSIAGLAFLMSMPPEADDPEKQASMATNTDFAPILLSPSYSASTEYPVAVM